MNHLKPADLEAHFGRTSAWGGSFWASYTYRAYVLCIQETYAYIKYCM